jgi:hypothetical protein
MILKCNHCKNEWNYKGNSNKYVTCPRCHYKVNIIKNLTDNDFKISYNELINKISKIENMLINIQNSISIKNNHLVKNKYNSPGILIQCSKCGYKWYFKGLKSIARCPECNHRVKVYS